MSMLPYFSIIIPVYNEDERLLRAVKSACEQTLEDLEILLIDDGSTESKTIKLLAECRDSDERIKLIRKDNGGVSSARNLGIREAEGEYLLFLDGDDYLNKDTCEQYASLMLDFGGEIDVLFTNYYVDDESTDSISKISPISEDSLLDNDINEALITVFGRSLYNNRGCFRRQLVREKSIVYNEDWAVFEDIDFALQTLLKAKKAAVTTYAGYHYCRFRKHAGLTLKRFESQVNASVFWLRKLREGAFEETTVTTLSGMLADLMVIYFLMTNQLPASDRKKAYDISSETKDYLIYGTSKAARLLQCMRLFGTRTPLIVLGYLYQVTHKRVVE